MLVILGLLIGGVLAGQSLIHAAELRAVSTEYNRFLAATQTFRDKYFSLPGDMPNATQFWGRSSSASDCVTNSGAAVGGVGTCDGNGDGRITLPVLAWNANQSGENFQYWRQLQLSGIIEGQNSGNTGASGLSGASPANWQPSKSASNTYWTMASNANLWFGTSFDYANVPPVTGRNAFFLGRLDGGGLIAVFTQTDSWNIDTKMDDGLPGRGSVRSTAQGWGGTGACVTGPFPNGAIYQTIFNNNSCSMAFTPDF